MLKTNILKLTYFFTFSELTFHDFLLEPNQNIYISALKKKEKKLNDFLRGQFFNAVLLLTRN
jgi:hypothetical protein